MRRVRTGALLISFGILTAFAVVFDVSQGNFPFKTLARHMGVDNLWRRRPLFGGVADAVFAF